MITQLAHLNIITDNCKKMIDFYVDKLGLKIIFTLDDENGNPFGWYIGCGKLTFIEIFDQTGAVKKWGGKVEEIKKGNQIKHFCLEVKGLEKFREFLIYKKVEVSEITLGMDNSKQMWIKDPDGNDIELMEYTDKSLQLRNIS